MAQKKMGRPKSDNPLRYEMKAYLTLTDYAEVLDYCKRHNISKAEFTRNAVFAYLQKDNIQKTT